MDSPGTNHEPQISPARLLRRSHLLGDFLTVIAEGSIRQAADKIAISQSALTRRIQDLEEGLGASLFERTSRGMTLTPFGEVLKHHAQLVADHQSKNPFSSLTTKDTLLAMKKKFVEWGVDLQWVILFPHIDDFNGRDPGHNWLGAVSRSVNDYHYLVGKMNYVSKRREVMTFCQWKVHEDTHI